MRPFGGRGASAEMDDVRLAPKRSGRDRQRARQVDFQLQRGEASAGRHHRVDAAAERRVEQGRGEAAVRHALPIVVFGPHRRREHHAAGFRLRQPEAEQATNGGGSTSPAIIFWKYSRPLSPWRISVIGPLRRVLRAGRDRESCRPRSSAASPGFRRCAAPCTRSAHSGSRRRARRRTRSRRASARRTL